MKLLIYKAAAVGALALVLLIALGMVQGIVSERQALQRQVEDNIADTSAGPQTLTGPVLVVPYRERVVEWEQDPKGEKKAVTREYERRAVFVPETLVIDGKANVTPRRRGLYRALQYTLTGRLDATFRVPANLGLSRAQSDITLEPAFLAIGITDVRGFQSPPKLEWNGATLTPLPGTSYAPLGAGIHAKIGALDPSRDQVFELRTTLEVLGLGSLAVTPVGRSTTMLLDSEWPHPSSMGRFLPRAKADGENYFPATWIVSQLANNAAATLIAQGDGVPAKGLDSFGVAFIEPVNVYLQSERALKYGVLFIGLTFAAFFLFELLRRLRIHPLQYGLVGLALTIFYLLLVSLAEHIAFPIAYGVASSACVVLLTYYLSHVLGGWRAGIAFGSQLTLLYGVLYGLLQSEDNALALGSVLLFAILATVMIVTRKIDWYALTERMAPVDATDKS